MATPKTVISETFYHKTSCLRFELGSYKDVTKFKIECAPQLKGPDGNPVEKRFDYEQKLSMVFGYTECLRLKRFVENTLNPQKNVPADGFAIDHFFEVNGEKKKSSLFLKRVENKGKDDQKSPYNFAHTIIITLYSSLKQASVSFAMSEEEAYWVINMMPFFAWAFMQENGRINEENRALKAAGKATGEDPASRTAHRAPAAGAADGVDQGAMTAGGKVTTPAFPDTGAFDDIPF
jgi:hypothetical protein